MKLHVLGSSSRGNCYIVESADEALIIEAGVRFSAVKRAVDFDVSKIVGCVISHEHNDHARYRNDIARAGIPVLTNGSVLELIALELRMNCIEAKTMIGRRLGGFKIVPFDVEHDVPCQGFYIEHELSGPFVILTDTYFCQYTFPNLSHLIVEANYSDPVLDGNISGGKTPASMRPRLLHSHMELSTCREFILSNDLSAVRNIVLVHLSDGNSDEEAFVRELTDVTGKNVIAADAGMVLDFKKEPF